MKVSTLLAAVTAAISIFAVACSSSSSSGSGSSSYPTCQGATGTSGAGSTACSSCVESHCGSQVSAVESTCSAYLSCYQGCQCSDATCLEGCVSKMDSACQNADGPLASCITQNCSSQCEGPDGG
jgi:hypothetical protein